MINHPHEESPHEERVAIENFDGSTKIVDANHVIRSTCCGVGFARPCLKFLVCVIISLGTTIFAIISLAQDGFKDKTITAFCCSLITSNISFWLSPPKVIENQHIS